MPRKPRIDIPGHLYHVIFRGIEKCNIFIDSKDYKSFIERLKKVILRSQGKCYAWTLMPNHCHLLIRSGKSGLADMMRKLLTGYAVYFNIRHKRAGHLFQNRYKATLCEADSYLSTLVRYIHLNPLKAGIVNNMGELGRYPWSGHSVIMGSQKQSWQDTDAVLGLFGTVVSKAKAKYFKFINEGINSKEDYEGGGLIRSSGGIAGALINRRSKAMMMYDDRILGEDEFVRYIGDKLDSVEDKNRDRIPIEKIFYEVAKFKCLEKNVLLGRSQNRKVVEARAIVAHIAVSDKGYTHTDCARVLGMTQSGINKLLTRKRKSIEAIDLKPIIKSLKS